MAKDISESSDEDRRQASHQELKASIDEDVNADIKQAVEQTPTKSNQKSNQLAKKLKQKSIDEIGTTERETERGRTAARISQIIDYIFALIYGLIALEFFLDLFGANSRNGFVQFIGAVTYPLLGPFQHILGTPSFRSSKFSLSYLLAIVVYIMLHLAINGAFRLVAYRKTVV